MPKWCKFLVALLLLPFCVGAAQALWRVLKTCGGADTTWIPLLAGAACWLVIFLLLPRPMWIYVLGHELTHALWSWLFGGRVKKMKVSSRGGHVVITKSNFLVVLAPYFFPLYAVIIVVIFAVGRWVWDERGGLVYFHLLVGAAYAFHVTLTIHALQTRQTDITSQGYLFSAVIIFLGNVMVLLFGVPLLTARVGLLEVAGWWLEDTGRLLSGLSQWL
ncbi:MAG TPA: M50 family metallopeptidase [Verrucomicrobiae bacterium]|nr:M50 family metallopeptidase [Verrucomicrobiae bacterium]